MAEQGQSSGGAAGTPIMGAVTTAAPTYVTATFGFLSLDTAGALRVSGSITAIEASVGATGAAVPASATYLGISIAGTLTGALGGHGTAAGALRVELPTDGTGIVGISQATPGTTNAVALAQVGSTTLATPELTGRVPTSEPDALLLSSASVTSATTINIGGAASVDTTGYSSINIQFTSIGTGNTITFEESNDNSNWALKAAWPDSSNGSAGAQSATTLSLTTSWTISVSARYFRERVSTYGSGTVTSIGYLRKNAGPIGISVNAQGTINAIGNVASGATDSQAPVKVGGVYNSTLPTFTTGQRGDAQINARGEARSLLTGVAATGADGRANTYLGGIQSGADASSAQLGVYPFVFNGSTWDRMYGSTTGLLVQTQAIATGGASFLNIAAGQATTVVKASAGTLYAIVLNSAATAANTTIVYDNATGAGTVIGRPAVTTATVPTTLTYGPAGLAFANGLTIITATQNGGDMTVIYK